MSLDTHKMAKLAIDHAEWFVNMVKPLLRTYMEHGYKHGWEDALEHERIKKLEKVRRCEKECSG